jgi:PTH1 family peptidyl-tRNA hydrolase
MKKNNHPILIVGLGNPGEQYESSPHNAGFLVVDELLRTWDVKLEIYTKLKSETGEYKLGSKKIIIAKPQTFMNKSGEAVKAITTYYKLQPTNSLWLIHDDVDLELGKIKIVKNRGAAGHKGVEDVMRKLRAQDFVRFRIGTRPKRLTQKRSKSLMNKFVASEIAKADQPAFKKAIKTCKDAVLLALEQGLEKAASEFNR